MDPTELLKELLFMDGIRVGIGGAGLLSNGEGRQETKADEDGDDHRCSPHTQSGTSHK